MSLFILPDNRDFLDHGRLWRRYLYYPRLNVKYNDVAIYLTLARLSTIVAIPIFAIHWVAVISALYFDTQFPGIPISADDYVYDFLWSSGKLYSFAIAPVLAFYGIILTVKNIRPNDYSVLEPRTTIQIEHLHRMSSIKRFIVSLFVIPVGFCMPLFSVGPPLVLEKTFSLLNDSILFLAIMTYGQLMMFVLASTMPTSAFIVLRAMCNQFMDRIK